jgi:membrane protein
MLRSAYELLRDTVSAWIDDKAPRLGAALAYYSTFAVAPIVILAVSLAGLVFGDKAPGAIADQLRATLGAPVAEAVESIVRSASNPTASKVAALVGLATLLFGACAVFIELQDALNTIWKVTPRPGRPIVTIIRERLVSFSMVLATGFLLLVSLVVTTALAAVADWLTPEWLPGGVALWRGVNWLASTAFIALLFALIFKVVPDVHIAWRDVWPGAVLTALLFTAGKYLLGLYIASSSVASAYGAAGSLVIVLVWVYYSAQILLFGAEMTRAQAKRRGADCCPARSAVPVTAEERARQGMPDRAAVGAAARR